MKKLTMVMRCGNPNDSAEAMFYTLIGEDYSFERMLGTQLVKAIREKKIEVTNMDVTDKGLVSTNGAIKNYTLISTTGQLCGQARAVVLNRVEAGDKLVGYTIFNTQGVLQEVNVDTAVKLAQNGLVANGKIRSTQQGDIVASIGGNYPLRIIEISKAKGDTGTSVDILFIGAALHGSSMIKYGGVLVNGKNAAFLSRLHSILDEVNISVIDDIKKITGEDERAALGIKLTGTAGFYGVYPLELIFELINRAGNKATMPMGSLTIACTDYANGKEEASVTVDDHLSVINHVSGSNEANKAIKPYAESVIALLKTVKFEQSAKPKTKTVTK